MNTPNMMKWMRIVFISIIVSLENNVCKRTKTIYFTFFFYLFFFWRENSLPRQLHRKFTGRSVYNNNRIESCTPWKNSDFRHEKGIRSRLIIHGRRKSVPTHHYLLSNRVSEAASLIFPSRVTRTTRGLSSGIMFHALVAWKSSIVGNNVRRS